MKQHIYSAVYPDKCKGSFEDSQWKCKYTIVVSSQYHILP